MVFAQLATPRAAFLWRGLFISRARTQERAYSRHSIKVPGPKHRERSVNVKAPKVLGKEAKPNLS